MKHPKQQAERWLAQAQHDLEIARWHLSKAFHSDCCFMCEQADQKALKAFLFARGQRAVPEHSIAVLVNRAAEYDGTLRALRDAARMLDQYYIPTRYPDALAPPAVPFESYNQGQAAQALELAQRIVEAIRGRLS